MKLGEWLLTKHSDHIHQLAYIQERYDQCKQEHASVTETIEQLSLRRKILGEPRSGSDFPDPTYSTALEYVDRYSADSNALTHQMFKLDERIRKIRDYVNVANIVLDSLDENDKWFVENHFINEISIVDLKDKKFPDGKVNSRTTLHNIKNRIIDDVTEMCGMMFFDPQDFNGESK